MTGLLRFAARYYDGRMARAQDVEIEIGKAGIAIYRPPGVFIAAWSTARLVLVEKPRPGEPLRIGLDGTTARLIVDDAGALAALLAAAPGAARSIRTDRRTVLRVAAWAAAAVASVAAIVLVIIPALSVQLARQTPDALKVRIGGAALEQMVGVVAYLPGEDRKPGYCTGWGGLDVLRYFARRITEGLPSPPTLRIAVIDANLDNAFALPGGYVIISRGLIDAAENAEEVVGVLAHEIGHVVHDHSTQAIFRSSAVSLLISAAIGDVTGGMLIGAVAEWTLDSSYSRSAEREADAFAVARLNAIGIDGTAFARGFERFLEYENRDGAKGAGAARYLSTHPPTQDRIAFIRENAQPAHKEITDEAWTSVRRICATTRPDPPAFLIVGGK